MMEQVLQATETTGKVFQRTTPFVVALDVYTDGWKLQRAFKKPDSDTLIWKDYTGWSLEEHGDRSRLRVTPSTNERWRMHGGTAGATAYIDAIELSIEK